MPCKKHTSCLVVHTDGKCPDYNQNAECACQKITLPNQPIPKWEEEFDKLMIPPKFTAQFYGKYCVICGHPMPNSEGARMMKNFIRTLLTTAHTEWREEAKREIEGKEREIDEIACDYADHLNKDTILNLHFLQPPKDTV